MKTKYLLKQKISHVRVESLFCIKSNGRGKKTK